MAPMATTGPSRTPRRSSTRSTTCCARSIPGAIPRSVDKWSELMATKVVVPRLGEGVDEVTVTKWLKKEGETVNELEPLLEVNTDKVDTEVPSPASGTVLKIVAQEGVPAKVGSILAFIGKPGESLEGAATVAAPGGEGAPAPANAQP